MKISSKDKLFDKGATMQKLLVVPALGLLLAGCNPADGTATSVASNDGFSLYCPNVGIAADQCILSDPENPYAGETVDDTTKYTFASSAANARDKFYVWATAQANSQSGENQYYTALSLQELYDANANASAQAQAKLAYKSVLDNYFDASAGESTPGNPISNVDLVKDTDYVLDAWGTGTAHDLSFTGDASFSPVTKITGGGSWGSVIAHMNFTAGLASNYQNLVFKVKDLDGGTFSVKFANGDTGVAGSTETEKAYSVDTVGTAITGADGWYQVSIPMSDFPGADGNGQFAIWSSGGDTWYYTDLGFTNAAGTAVANDTGDGFVSLYNPGASSTDLVKDTDFILDAWGTGTAHELNYTGDASYSPVAQVTGGGSWGSVIAHMNFTGGLASNYNNLVFKAKDFEGGTFSIKFAGGGTTETEKAYDVATVGTAIPGADGWYQITIPMTDFPGVEGNIQFAIWSSGGDTWYFTELGFEGDATGNGLVGDTAGDDIITMYKSDTVTLASSKYRDLVGENLVEPASLDNLYDDAAAATTALSGWGYSYDTASNSLTSD